MKATYPFLLLSILPMMAPLASFAEPEATPAATTTAALESDKPIGAAWRASEIIGTDVQNTSDESVGDVKDLVVDLQSGEILAVVVSTGGFLGIGDTLSALPPNTLTYDPVKKAFNTQLTKEQLQKAPQHKSSDEIDYSQAAASTKLRQYRDSIGGNVKAPDNTANNVGDHKEGAVTPVNQGNNESDLKITKDIRADIVGSDLSFNAKNIKIVTQSGHVTLKGVVDSKTEHEAVLQYVQKHADVSKVTDELQVK